MNLKKGKMDFRKNNKCYVLNLLKIVFFKLILIRLLIFLEVFKFLFLNVKLCC